MSRHKAEALYRVGGTEPPHAAVGNIEVGILKVVRKPGASFLHCSDTDRSQSVDSHLRTRSVKSDNGTPLRGDPRVPDGSVRRASGSSSCGGGGGAANLGESGAAGGDRSSLSSSSGGHGALKVCVVVVGIEREPGRARGGRGYHTTIDQVFQIVFGGMTGFE